MRKILRGIAASPGIGVGRIQLYRTEKIDSLKREIQDRAVELERYHFALEKFCGLLREKAERVALVAGQERADILLSQIAMANDPYLVGQVEGRISAFQSAEAALDAVCTLWFQKFLTSENEVTRLRAADIQDLRDGLLRVLLGLPESDLSRLAPETVLVARELPPSAMTALDAKAVAGIVLCKGGRASHCAILARAMGIPTVVGAPEAVAWSRNGEWAVVDGAEGQAYLSPSEEELADWRERAEEYRRRRETLRSYVGRNATTADLLRVRLTASAGSESEALLAEEYGCDGVGLFRSEFLYLDRPSLPGEEEQFQVYRRLAKEVHGKPLAIRTLDIGGDKRLPGLSWEREDNPFLGCRAIRFCRREEKLFKDQLRAILRAGVYGDVRLLVPMVTGLEELRWVKALLRECGEELRGRGQAFREDMPVGIMAETPSASLLADLLAKEADFISIGVNDLTQYTMAVDRDNAKVAYLYSYYDPALLRSIRRIIDCGKAAGTPVCLCGQAAADPLFIPLLLAFGLEEFSVQPNFLLSVRRCISLWTKGEACRLAEQAMSLTTEDQVRRLLEENQRL